MARALASGQDPCQPLLVLVVVLVGLVRPLPQRLGLVQPHLAVSGLAGRHGWHQLPPLRPLPRWRLLPGPDRVRDGVGSLSGSWGRRRTGRVATPPSRPGQTSSQTPHRHRPFFPPTWSRHPGQPTWLRRDAASLASPRCARVTRGGLGARPAGPLQDGWRTAWQRASTSSSVTLPPRPRPQQQQQQQRPPLSYPARRSSSSLGFERIRQHQQHHVQQHQQ